MLRKVRILLFLLVIGATLLAGIFYWPSSTESKRPPLTNMLHGTWREMSANFDKRLKAAFPLGSEADAMIKELSRQGFQRVDTSNLPAETYQARLDEQIFPCDEIALVQWKQGSGRITEISGAYLPSGCL